MNEEYYEEDFSYDDEELREEEWNALTDGQYGDYPGGDIDYDIFGFWGEAYFQDMPATEKLSPF